MLNSYERAAEDMRLAHEAYQAAIVKRDQVIAELNKLHSDLERAERDFRKTVFGKD